MVAKLARSGLIRPDRGQVGVGKLLVKVPCVVEDLERAEGTVALSGTICLKYEIPFLDARKVMESLFVGDGL
jgi:hypothetical protein